MPTQTRTRRQQLPAEQPAQTTAVATRPDQTPAAQQQQHPLVVAIEERMPAIAEMLPDGMDPKRFRRVVVQALARNPQLLSCTPLSVITAVTEAAEAGLEPTGVLGRAWLIPYGRDAKLIIGYRGYAELAWRADRVLLTVDVVREGDAFSYQRGTQAFLHHTPAGDPDREIDDANITAAYCLARFPDGREDFEVMSLAALERIRDRARTKNPVWESDFGEMAKKTPLRRLLKRLPLSPSVQRFLAADESIDFDTPVERIPAAAVTALPAGASRTSQAAARAEALAEPAQAQAEPDPPAEDLSGEIEHGHSGMDGIHVHAGSRESHTHGVGVGSADIPAEQIPFEQPAEASTSASASQEAPARAASAGPCPHQPAMQLAIPAGVICSAEHGGCGQMLAYRDQADAPREANKPKAPAQALMARIHVGRTHEEARAIAAAVLELDPDGEWSMADLDAFDLQAVVDAIRHEDSRRSARPTRRREPAAAGRRSR